MIDLNPRHLATVKGILVAHVPGCEVRAFGSRATWTAKDYSDLDLAIVGEEPLDRETLSQLQEAFKESDLPMRVDVIDWHAISQSFRDAIKQGYVVVETRAESDAAGEATQWRRVTLNDVVDLRLSSVDKKSKANEEAVQLCNYLDVYNNNFIHADMDFMAATATEREIAKCSLIAGDVVITKDSEKHDDIGIPALVREDIPDLVCGYHLAILRPRLSEIDGTYLFYALGSDQAQQQFHSYANGITRFGLRKSDIGLVEIPLPPLEEQRAIAHVLGTLDDKIELNRRMNATLEAMARAVFKDWFLDFGPVRAKLEGREPYLPPEAWSLFPDRLVDSELGEVPEGWEVEPLGELIELAYGKALKAADRRGGSIPVYGSNGQVGWHDERLVAGPGVVVGRKGNPGVVTWVHDDFFPIDTTFYVVPRNTKGSLPFLFFGLIAQDLPSVSADSAVPGLNRNLAYMNRQLIPDDPLMSEFDDYANGIFARRYRLEEESRNLTSLRDVLLPKLVSGEVSLGNSHRAINR